VGSLFSVTASAAGVDSGDAAAVKELLPLIEERSKKVASAPDIASIRSELAELTMPLVRFHAMVQGSRPVLAYCPKGGKGLAPTR